MPTLTVETPEGVALRHELAGAGSRAAAMLIDLIVFAIPLVLLFFGLTGAGGGAAEVLLRALGVGAVLVFAAYHTFFPLVWNGQTPGKAALEIAVLGREGQPAGLLPLALRSVFLLVEWIPAPIPVGFYVISSSPDRQRLGDAVAGTVVVRRARAHSTSEPFARETWSGLAHRTLDLSPALAARLGREDFEFLRRLLMRQGLDYEHRRQLFVRTARHYADRLGFGEFGDARVVLKELYLYLRERRFAGSTSAAPTPPSRSAAGDPGSPPAPARPRP